MKKKRLGRDSYIDKGFNRVLTIYVSEETHEALKKQASEEERSLQTIVRRILEQHTKAG